MKKILLAILLPVIFFSCKEAEKKRLEMVESKKPFVKNPGYEHPNSRYYSTSLNSITGI